METTLYGKPLDLTTFMKLHKGGTLALTLAAGRDCTNLYEQYHPRASSTHPFHADLTNAVNKLPHTKATWTHVAMCSTLAVIAAKAWWHWFCGDTWSVFALPLVHWLILVNVSHEAAHFAFSSLPWINELLALTSAPLFYNSSFWYLQHNVSHHGNTNHPDKDVDLSHFYPIARLHLKSRNNNFASSIKLGTIVVLFFLSTLVQSFLYPFWAYKKLKYLGNVKTVLNRTRFTSWLQLISSAMVIAIPFTKWSLGKALVFSFVPFFLSSLVFMCVTQISHIQESTQTDAADHWAIQQVQSSMDYSQGSHFVTFMTGGLNSQGLHHCLPFLSSCHFLEIYPIYRDLCKKHDLKIRESPSFLQAFTSYAKHIVNLL